MFTSFTDLSACEHAQADDFALRLSTKGSAGHRLAEQKIDITLKEGTNRLLATEERIEHGFGFTALLCNKFGDEPFDVSYRIP